jgi:phosphoglycerate dehydrogenase-like enzyme
MKLLLTGALHLIKAQEEQIKALGYQILWMQEERGPLPDAAEEAEAVVCNSLFLHHDISLFPNLKFIQATSAGLDLFPLKMSGKGASAWKMPGGSTASRWRSGQS